MAQGVNPEANFPYHADALGFLAPQAAPPLAAPDLHNHVDLMHVTAAPPIFDSLAHTIDGATTPDGRFIPGLENFTEVVRGQDNLLAVTDRESFNEALRDPLRTGIIFGLQRAPMDVLQEPGGMERLRDLGVRVMALEYRYGDGVYGSGWLKPDGPLTDEGRELIEAMADNGITLDLSHSGWRTAEEALDHITQRGMRNSLPVMASHGGVAEFYDGHAGHINNRRNLPAATLGRVVALGGVFGIYSLTFGLSRNNDSAVPMLAQIRAAETLYPGAVVIGSDATYQERSKTEWRKTHKFMLENVVAGTEMEARYPDTPLEFNTPGRLTVIRNELITDGMSGETADGIVGQRLVRFFRKALAK